MVTWKLEHAKEAYESGCNHCPNCISFWHSLGNLEEKSNGLRKARALSKNPLSHENWLVTIRVESKHGNKKEADSYITKALQKCPNSGILRAELLLL